MAIITSVLTGGDNLHETTSEEVNAVATDFVSEGVVGAITNTSDVAPMTGAYAVNAQGTPDMTVAVTAGVAYVTGTPTGQSSQTLRVKLTANENVTISANSSGSTKYDWIYIDVDADAAADPAVGADDVSDLVTSRSSSSSTDDGTPPTYGTLIAVVTVSNGASSITNGNISDRRVRTGAKPAEGDVGTDQLADDAVTPAKWTNPYCFRAYDSAGSTLTDGTASQVAFATEVYDHNNNFASSAYTAPVAGVYHFDFAWRMGTIATGVDMYAAIYIDAVLYTAGPRVGAISSGGQSVSADIPLTAGQVVTFYAYQNSAGNEGTATGNDATWCSGHLVHAT